MKFGFLDRARILLENFDKRGPGGAGGCSCAVSALLRAHFAGLDWMFRVQAQEHVGEMHVHFQNL